jgi:hypothetical protein
MGFQVDAPCVVLVTITDKNLIFHRVTLVWAESLVSNSLHVFDEQLLGATVVKFCGAAVSVPGDALGNL